MSILPVLLAITYALAFAIITYLYIRAIWLFAGFLARIFTQ